jgi:hypothetical protein
MSKSSSFSDGSSSSLILSSEIESSLEEILTEKSLNSSNEANFESKITTFTSQDTNNQNQDVNNSNRDGDLNKDKTECKTNEYTGELNLNSSENLNLKKNSKPFSNSKLCPNCELLKKTDVNSNGFFIISKDLFMKILLIIMLFVMLLNYILYIKLANLEQMANGLVIHNKLTSKI